MVKSYWLAVMFAVGVAVGVMFSRPHTEVVATAVVPAVQKPPAPDPNVRHPANQEKTNSAAPTPDESLVARDPKAAPAGKSGSEAQASNIPAQPGGFSGNSVPIDVGPVFREQFEEARSHGLKSPLLDFHQALEREERNDAWAYTAESDIQNLLVADTSAGNFKVDHLECRATSCELRLSARGTEQSEALTRWQQGMRSQQWGSQLQPRASSMIGRDENADILVIFTQPEKKPQEKKPDKTAPRKATMASQV